MSVANHRADSCVQMAFAIGSKTPWRVCRPLGATEKRLQKKKAAPFPCASPRPCLCSLQPNSSIMCRTGKVVSLLFYELDSVLDQISGFLGQPNLKASALQSQKQIPG